jgi:ubiquinone/menaquinone biosynthesis C-methylase UbiE
MTRSTSSAETHRIREEYIRRDKLDLSHMYRYVNPSFQFHMQEREWGILRFLQFENVRLEDASVLEVGCGTGHILERFREFGIAMGTGIDLMEERLESGKNAYPCLRFVHGNGAELPFHDNSFDLVMQFMCLSSVLDPQMRRDVADEMWRVLKPGGAILSYDLRPSPFLVRSIRLFQAGSKWVSRSVRGVSSTGSSIRGTGSPTPIKPLSVEEFKRVFRTDRVRYCSISLDFNLSGTAGRSFLLATLLSHIPFLRTHFLVLCCKPKYEA